LAWVLVKLPNKTVQPIGHKTGLWLTSALGSGEDMAKDTKRIDEEIVCADSFACHLKQKCGCNRVEIQRETDDPPDFWLTIDGIRFAVEVTSIADSGSGLAISHFGCLVLDFKRACCFGGRSSIK
jgi:hypothetical protein